MFDTYNYPYTDFNKVNLDWIMSRLPQSCELSTASDEVTIIGYNAFIAGEYVVIDIHLYADSVVPLNTALFTIPYYASVSYITSTDNSNVKIFIDENTKIAYNDIAFSGHIYAKMLFTVNRGF